MWKVCDPKMTKKKNKKEREREDSEVSYVSNIFRGLVVGGMLRPSPPKVKATLLAFSFPTTKKEILYL